MSGIFKVQHHFQAPSSDGLVETVPFLNASNEVLVIIDYLGPSFLKTAFHRTRSDIAGNILTLKKKHDLDPSKYHTLNAMLEEEREVQCSDATIALLWLKRALEFLYHFSLILLKSECYSHVASMNADNKKDNEEDNQDEKREDKDKDNEANKEKAEGDASLCSITLQAYGLSLKRFHNYLLQGLFYLVAQLLPSKEHFLCMLSGGDRSRIGETLQELASFTDGLRPNLDIVNQIYIQMGRNEEY